MTAPRRGDAGRRDTASGPGPVFLERATYRQRRLVDGMRLLPLVGVCLWLVPLLWNGRASETPTSFAVIYVFGVWFGLVVVAGILAVRMPRIPDEDEAEDRPGDPRPGP